MDRHNGTKINNLLKIMPKGTVAIQSWLNEHGIYRQLTDVYCQHAWLERLDNGVYIRSGDQIDWTGALYSLQKKMSMQLHLGAQSALEMNGAGHYVSLGENGTKWLFINDAETKKTPTWFKRNFVVKHNLQLKCTKLFSGAWDLGLQEIDLGNFTIFISSPERAVMEVLYLTPDHVSIEYSALLMDKLRTLRPALVQKLLELCNSVKVKRLFLYFAESQNQPWLNNLDLSKVDLGKGNRQITKGGQYNAKYKLVVPNLNSHEGYTDDESYL